MEVNLSPDLVGKLAQAAGRRGVSAEVLIREAIERAVDYDDWFIREVEKGLAQIDAGQVLTHEAVGARLNEKLSKTRVTSINATAVDRRGSLRTSSESPNTSSSTRRNVRSD
jgi:predicted transcriptional regulator